MVKRAGILKPRQLTGVCPMSRPIYAIAMEINKIWPDVNFAAQPYLDAMSSIVDINDNFYADTAKSVVRYFLANASSWRGEDARRIKKELKALVK